MLIAYYRVSTQRQGNSGLGLEAQKNAVHEHAKRLGQEIGAEYTEIESGRNCARPKLKVALSDAKARSATLVVAKLDRLARDARFVLELCDGGVSLLFLDLPDLPASDPIVGRLILTVMAAVAEFEARRIGQRIREAMARYRARGGKLGAAHPNCPGFRTTPRERQQEYARIGCEHARRKAEAFRSQVRPVAADLRSAGKSLAAVATEMNARGIQTPRRRKWTPGLVAALLKVSGTE